MKTKITLILVCSLASTVILAATFWIQMSDRAKQRQEQEQEARLQYRQGLVNDIKQAGVALDGIRAGVHAGLIDDTNATRMRNEVFQGMQDLQARLDEFDRTNAIMKSLTN